MFVLVHNDRYVVEALLLVLTHIHDVFHCSVVGVNVLAQSGPLFDSLHFGLIEIEEGEYHHTGVVHVVLHLDHRESEPKLVHF